MPPVSPQRRSQWVSSIKTRIKTVLVLRWQIRWNPQWVSSIKTRIKTLLILNTLTVSFVLNEYLPLKQGLRLFRFSFLRPELFSQWVSSIKTRIKTKKYARFVRFARLNEYLPLKQGLRLNRLRIAVSIFLNEYLPLKQGLRQSERERYVKNIFLNEYLPLKQGLRL